MVSDTYDYWNLVNNLLPQCKKEIMEHNGKMLIRPDSGDIVKISVADGSEALGNLRRHNHEKVQGS